MQDVFLLEPASREQFVQVPDLVGLRLASTQFSLPITAFPVQDTIRRMVAPTLAYEIPDPSQETGQGSHRPTSHKIKLLLPGKFLDPCTKDLRIPQIEACYDVPDHIHLLCD